MPKADIGARHHAAVAAAKQRLREDTGNPALLRALEDARRAWNAALDDDAAGLLVELREQGFQGVDLGDLIGESRPYPSLLPILTKHLSEPHITNTYDTIARALTIRDAGPAEFEGLWNLYVRAPATVSDEESDGIYLQAVGNALAFIASQTKDHARLRRLLDYVKANPKRPAYSLVIRGLVEYGGARELPVETLECLELLARENKLAGSSILDKALEKTRKIIVPKQNEQAKPPERSRVL